RDSHDSAGEDANSGYLRGRLPRCGEASHSHTQAPARRASAPIAAEQKTGGRKAKKGSRAQRLLHDVLSSSLGSGESVDGSITHGSTPRPSQLRRLVQKETARRIFPA